MPLLFTCDKLGFLLTLVTERADIIGILRTVLEYMKRLREWG